MLLLSALEPSCLLSTVSSCLPAKDAWIRESVYAKKQIKYTPKVVEFPRRYAEKGAYHIFGITPDALGGPLL